MNEEKIDVLAYLRTGYEGVEQRKNDADPEIAVYYTHAATRARRVHDAVAQLFEAAKCMMTQDQVRSATYNGSPHMASASDRLRAAIDGMAANA